MRCSGTWGGSSHVSFAYVLLCLSHLTRKGSSLLFHISFNSLKCVDEPSGS
ncbi:hypothetical protein PR003_g21322 [Phytophthora rubi]|uniref:Uncharacterized protein n=1 Tax=Phytophthora rubi TaxID=129364 RepID=A0A6A4DF69_9STRA|nr:hypothetical protein PR003_g21322 [Phytophthora rubi]